MYVPSVCASVMGPAAEEWGASDEHLHVTWTHILVQGSNDAITKASPTIVTALPQLWEATKDHNTVRAPIVSMVTSIVRAVKAAHAQLLPVILPLIELGTNLAGGDAIYLCDYSLELWGAVVSACSCGVVWSPPRVAPLLTTLLLSAARVLAKVHAGAAQAVPPPAQRWRQ